MSDIETRLQEENEKIKELFNFDGDESQLKQIKTSLKNSQNGPYYFVKLIDIYCKRRPKHNKVSRDLIESIYSSFPERTHEIQHHINELITLLKRYSICIPLQEHISEEVIECVKTSFSEEIKEIEQYIKDNTVFLKFIMFPDEFPINTNKEQNELFPLLQHDCINEFISFHSHHSTLDLHKEQTLTEGGYYYSLFDVEKNIQSISLLDFCCLFGSLKCFMYLLINQIEITDKTKRYAISGGNQQIIAILCQNGQSFDDYLETSIKYHRYELTKWLLANYKCPPISLLKCIQYYNIDSFLYFLAEGYSLDSTDENQLTCLHRASEIGNIPLVEFLIHKCSDIEAKNQFDQRTPLHFSCL